MILGKVTSPGDYAAQCRVARVTFASAGAFGASAEGEVRSASVVGPAGVRWSPAQGDAVALLPTPEGVLCLGRVEAPSLPPGEIKLEGPSGGYLWLKSDGSVVINGLTISADGRLVEG